MSKKPKTPKPARVKCCGCDAEYDAGQPHEIFCPGCPPDAECENCGNVGGEDEDVRVARCRDCEQVFCIDCGNTDERRCCACDEPQDGE